MGHAVHKVHHKQHEWGSAHNGHHKNKMGHTTLNVHHTQLEWGMQYIKYITKNMNGAQHIMDVKQNRMGHTTHDVHHTT